VTLNVCAGIFVGGRARRMGGAAKGLLAADGGKSGGTGDTIIERWARLFGDLGITCVLVGAHEAYAQSGILQIPDDASTEGPLAGLIALLEHAGRAGSPSAIAVACDMPFVSAGLVRRLMDAPPATIVAARRDGRWEPFFARYDAASVLPVARTRAAERKMSLQGLLDACGATEMAIDPGEHHELRDWDSPEDLDR
jgi:molybdopterin-guanine dinucleotide biosynthesis protein A